MDGSDLGPGGSKIRNGKAEESPCTAEALDRTAKTMYRIDSNAIPTDRTDSSHNILYFVHNLM